MSSKGRSRRSRIPTRQPTGLYVHSSPPTAVPVHPSIVRQWLRGGEIERLTDLVLQGQGASLVGEYSPDSKARAFINSLPRILRRIEELHEAGIGGRVNEVEQVLKREPRFRLELSRDTGGLGLLHKAVIHNHVPLQEWLLGNYPDTVNVLDKEKRNPLHYAGGCSETWNRLAEAGADTQAVDTEGNTPAFYMLHPRRLRPPLPDTRGKKQEQGLVVKPSNIRIWIHDKDLGRLQKVLWEGLGDKLKTETSAQPTVRRFLNAVPYIMGSIREVHTAAINNDLELLISRTQEPVPKDIFLSKDVNGLCPLHKAAGVGSLEVAKEILSKAPESVHAKDNLDRTPLHYAAGLKDQGEMYQLLVDAGAIDHLEDKRGNTPSHYKGKPSELEGPRLLNVIPDAPRTAHIFPPSWDWRLLTRGAGAQTASPVTSPQIEQIKQLIEVVPQPVKEEVNEKEEEFSEVRDQEITEPEPVVEEPETNKPEISEDEGVGSEFLASAGDTLSPQSDVMNEEEELDEISGARLGETITLTRSLFGARAFTDAEKRERGLGGEYDSGNEEWALGETGETPESANIRENGFGESTKESFEEEDSQASQNSQITNPNISESINNVQGVDNLNGSVENSSIINDAARSASRREGSIQSGQRDPSRPVTNNNNEDGPNIRPSSQRLSMNADENEQDQFNSDNNEEIQSGSLMDGQGNETSDINKSVRFGSYASREEFDGTTDSDAGSSARPGTYTTEEESNDVTGNLEGSRSGISTRGDVGIVSRPGTYTSVVDQNLGTRNNGRPGTFGSVKEADVLIGNDNGSTTGMTADNEDIGDSNAEGDTLEPTSEDGSNGNVERRMFSEVVDNGDRSGPNTANSTIADDDNRNINEEIKNISRPTSRNLSSRRSDKEGVSSDTEAQDNNDVPTDVTIGSGTAIQGNNSQEDEATAENVINVNPSESEDDVNSRSGSSKGTASRVGRVENQNRLRSNAEILNNDRGEEENGSRYQSRADIEDIRSLSRADDEESLSQFQAGNEEIRSLSRADDEESLSQFQAGNEEIRSRTRADNIESRSRSRENDEEERFQSLAGSDDSRPQSTRPIYRPGNTVTKEKRSTDDYDESNEGQENPTNFDDPPMTGSTVANLPRTSSRQNSSTNRQSETRQRDDQSSPDSYVERPQSIRSAGGSRAEILAITPAPPEPLQEDSDRQKAVEDQISEEEKRAAEDLVDSGDMEAMAEMVLAGQGSALLGLNSENPDVQLFINNVPQYMAKIERVHKAAREGDLRGVQTSLDRRKFAVARDNSTPLKPTPLHVAALFGRTSVLRYLAGRFPETMHAQDAAGRSPLHYASTLPDNGHFYSLLVTLGANKSLVDNAGRTAEHYLRNRGDLTRDSLLAEYQERPVPIDTSGLNFNRYSDKVANDTVSSRQDVDDQVLIAQLESSFQMIQYKGKGTMLQKILREDIFEELKLRSTRLDNTLLDLLKPGIRDMALGKLRITKDTLFSGIEIPDYESIRVFEDLLLPIIREINNISPEDEIPVQPPTDFLGSQPNDYFETMNLDPTGYIIKSFVVEISRNLSPISFSRNLKLSDLEKVEVALSSVLTGYYRRNKDSGFIDESGENFGSYYSLSEVVDNKEVFKDLEQDALLTEGIDDPNSENWPYGRGAFISPYGDITAWINVREHLKLLSVTSSDRRGYLGIAYKTAADIVISIDEKVKSVRDPVLGLLVTDPRLIGNALSFNLLISLPNLCEDKPSLRRLCKEQGLFIQSTTNPVQFRIKNKSCLGLSEIDSFKTFTDSIKIVVETERSSGKMSMIQIPNLIKNFLKNKNKTKTEN